MRPLWLVVRAVNTVSKLQHGDILSWTWRWKRYIRAVASPTNMKLHHRTCLTVNTSQTTYQQ